MKVAKNKLDLLNPKNVQIITVINYLYGQERACLLLNAVFAIK